MVGVSIGELLRTWRSKRGCSQLALASQVGVSTRHLSFVETGRSRPSPDLVLALAHHLEVPLRDRNTLLLAAGYAPRFSNLTLDDDAMTLIRSSLARVLEAHDPYPGLVLDRHWNIVMTNRAAGAMLELLPAHLRSGPINLFRISLHPDGFARYTTNLDRWAGYLLRQLDRIVTHYGDDEVRNLASEVHELVTDLPIGVLDAEDDNGLVVTCDLDLGGRRLSLFTTLTTFGSPHDVTLDELLIELFFPADAETERALGGSPTHS